jgi:chromosome segregation and condensation protein ScpB
MSGDKIPLPSSLQEIVGSLLFASESPLSVSELRNAIKSVEPEEEDDKEIMDVYKTCTTREVEQALHGLEKELERAGVGFRLVCAGGTYRLQSTPSCGRYVRALLHLDRQIGFQRHRLRR